MPLLCAPQLSDLSAFLSLLFFLAGSGNAAC